MNVLDEFAGKKSKKDQNNIILILEKILHNKISFLRRSNLKSSHDWPFELLFTAPPPPPVSSLHVLTEFEVDVLQGLKIKDASIWRLLYLSNLQ